MNFTKGRKKLVNMEQKASSSHIHHPGYTKDNPWTEDRAYKTEQERRIN
jgi:hypothetical protein